MKRGVDYIGVSVGALIFNEDGKVFLTKRSQNAKNERGHWEAPGGGVEYGELLEDSIRREMREEHGIEIDITQQFPAADHLIPADHQHWVATTFLAKVREGSVPQIMEPEKCDEIGWFSLDDLPSPLSIITKHDLEEYKRKLAKPATR